MCRLEVSLFRFQCGHICRYSFPSLSPSCEGFKEAKKFNYKAGSCSDCARVGGEIVPETITFAGLEGVVRTPQQDPARLSVPELQERRRAFLKEVNAFEISRWKEEMQKVILDEYIKDTSPCERTFFIGELVSGLGDPFFRPVPGSPDRVRLPCDCCDMFSHDLEDHFAGSNVCPGCDKTFKILRDSDIPVITEEDMLSEAVKALL